MAELRAFVGNFIGPQGPKGETGAIGPQGPQGATGPKGATGNTGQRGSQWYNGTGITGTSTTATIFASSGVSAALVGDYYLNTSTGYVYRCTVAGAASVAKWVYAGSIKGATGAQGPQGTKGDTGPQGPKGDAGAQGLQGPKGDTGAAGATGATGQRGSQWYSGTGITGTSTTATIFTNSGVSAALVGDYYLNTSTGYVYRCTVAGAASVAKWAYSGSIKGATGAQGPQGQKGDTGPQGPKGDTGSVGPQGPKGDTGPQGIPGIADIATASSPGMVKSAGDIKVNSDGSVTIPSLATLQNLIDDRIEKTMIAHVLNSSNANMVLGADVGPKITQITDGIQSQVNTLNGNFEVKSKQLSLPSGSSLKISTDGVLVFVRLNSPDTSAFSVYLATYTTSVGFCITPIHESGQCRMEFTYDGGSISIKNTASVYELGMAFYW